jgi:hypothetical protein
MVRWGRLIHTVRLPLLFTKLRDELFVLAGNSYICTIQPSSELARSRASTALSATSPPIVSKHETSTPAVATPIETGGGSDRERRRSSTVVPVPSGEISTSTPVTSPGLNNTESVTLQWYRNLLDSFVRDYVAYLSSIQLKHLWTQPRASAFYTSATDAVDTPRVFLIKVAVMMTRVHPRDPGPG